MDKALEEAAEEFPVGQDQGLGERHSFGCYFRQYEIPNSQSQSCIEPPHLPFPEEEKKIVVSHILAILIYRAELDDKPSGGSSGPGSGVLGVDCRSMQQRVSSGNYRH